MANENDVVRLKHLNSLASVVHDITLHSGGSSQALPDNADFALYVPNDTSIIITGKQAPVLSLGSWSSADTVYSAPITYTGDGTLSTDIGTISNDILTVEDVDGNFNGIISASSGYDYAATKINFNYMTDTVTVEGEPATVTVEAEPVTIQADPKTIPAFNLGEWSASGNNYSAVISYNGDGTLTTNTGTISGSTLTVADADGNFSGVISASAGASFAATELNFNYNTRFIKHTPTLSLDEFLQDGTTYTAAITYNGDGTLSTNIGTIANDILTIEDAGGAFSGTISASEGEFYSAASVSFNHVGKRAPNLSVGLFSEADASRVQAPITYDGDGNLTTNRGTISGGYIYVGNNNTLTTGTVSASGTDNFLAATATFTFGKAIYNTVSTGTGTKLSGTSKRDYVYNSQDTVTIDSGADGDYIYNKGHWASIIAGGGDDYIDNNYANKTIIKAGAGNDSIKANGNNVTIDAGEGNDSINTTGTLPSIIAGEGDDYIYNIGSFGKLAGDAGNDSINNEGSKVTIEGGAGADYISNSGSNVLFKYKAGDGNELIQGFNETATLSIVSGSYSTQVSGNDVIVNVGTGKISLIGAATLSPLNIVSA